MTQLELFDDHKMPLTSGKVEEIPENDIKKAIAAWRHFPTERVDHFLETRQRTVSASFRRALIAYVTKREIIGRPITQRGLAQLSTTSEENVKKAIGRQSANFWFDPVRLYNDSRLWASKPESDKTQKEISEKFFNGKLRLYFNLYGGLSETGKKITQFLETRGYSNIDYVQGTAHDQYGRPTRIGRLLTKDKTSGFLIDEYNKDESGRIPVENFNELMVVISRHPMDIARMSQGRPWKSCARRRYNAGSLVESHIQRQDLVAYLISKDDPLITQPVARNMVVYDKKKIAFTPALYAYTTLGYYNKEDTTRLPQILMFQRTLRKLAETRLKPL